MQIEETKLAEVKLIQPRCFGDERGYFFESWQQQRYRDAGIKEQFVQDNVSLSKKNVLRGLHFQNPNGQGKLVQVLYRAVYDVVVDIRINSPSFKEWFGIELSAENKKQLYIPPGFAHGFVVLSNEALFCYKCTEFYDPKHEYTVIWNDASIAVDWLISNPLVSEKDQAGSTLSELEVHLPQSR